MLKVIASLFNKFYGLINRVKVVLQKAEFAEHGNNINIGRNCNFIAKNIHLGHHVHIGPYASFISSIAHIYIGNYVMFGPHVTIRGGDHRIDIIGKHIYEISEAEKLPENDKDVIIEDGCWIGCNVTILKGVTIGRGSVIGAGSLVTKSIPPYSIAAGVPAKVLRERFTEEEITLHEKILKERNI